LFLKSWELKRQDKAFMHIIGIWRYQMSWAGKLKQEKVETDNYEDRFKMSLLRTTVKKAKIYCEENNQDWTTLVCGLEGSGKSTLASHMALMFDNDFSIEESMIYNLKGEDHSLVNFMQKWGDIPFKVTWYDEAVTVMFSHRANSKEVTDAQEIFKIKRDCKHYDLLVTPAFWDIVPDIRERRAKSLLYTFTEVCHPTETRTVYKHKYAYFGGDKIIQLSLNKKVKFVFRSPKELFKLVKPNFIEEFPEMDSKISDEYMNSKRDNRKNVIERINGGKTETKDKKDIKPHINEVLALIRKE
jgi:energy-coupling factor transporter ATP-binding protein EcfA2